MKIFFLSTLNAGYDLFRFVSKEIKISGYIGLTENRENSDISGYFNARKSLPGEIPFYEYETYNLSSANDKKLTDSLDIDVLIVGGWQRLIPDELIKKCRVCAIGIHGSPLGILKGRGRSPQNWSLMYDWPSFEFSIFKIDTGIDSGSIIDTASFKYHAADNIRSSYIKATFIAANLIVKAIKTGKIFSEGIVQSEENAEYLPQRLAEDGEIDWNRSCNEIYNFVRALTRPYPGAFSTINDNKIIIWSCVPFETSDFSEIKNGTVTEVLSNNELLVKCGTGFIIVTDFTFSGNISELLNKKLNSVDFESQIKKIKERHTLKYPELKISEFIK
jgi:methionyl-tRNA formyltransferase